MGLKDFWADKTSPSQQDEMAEFLKYLVQDRDALSSQDQAKALEKLSEFMQSDSVDIMKPRTPDDPESLLEQFLCGFYRADLGQEKDFFRNVFKVILNAKQGDVPKADLTSHLPNDRNPLIGYFAGFNALRPFLDVALESAAFDKQKFDASCFLSALGRSGRTLKDERDVYKQLLLHDCDPVKYGCFDTRELIKAREELIDEGHGDCIVGGEKSKASRDAQKKNVSKVPMARRRSGLGE